MSKGVLDGIRIADFTWAWAGPYATMLLSLFGAEVIKIESMRKPDHVRVRALAVGRFPDPNRSPFFNELNLNKLGVRLDLTKPEAVEIAKRLISVSDIVAQNMRPGSMDRMGLGYDELKKIKEDIIMLSSSACGSTGPESGYIGFAPTFAALSGVTYLTGFSDSDPMSLMGSIDLRSATTSAFAVLAALNYRAKTGKGQHIDLSSTESISVLLGDVFMDYSMNNRNRPRMGNHDDIMAPHSCYACKGDDKWITIAIATDEEWRAFCLAIGKPEWIEDDRFSDVYTRWNNQDELDKLIEGWTKNHTNYEVMELLQKAGIAAFPTMDSEIMFTDPHLNERHFSEKVNHPSMGERVVIGNPWKLSKTPTQITRPGPLIGQDEEYVYGELLGMTDREIKDLIDREIIY